MGLKKNEEPTDGNTAQWEKLKAARDAANGDAPQKPKMEVITGNEPKDEAPPPERARDEAGKFTKAAEEAPKETAPPLPSGEEIELDGQKVIVDRSLAAAFKQAEAVTRETAKETEKQSLKAELREELRREFAATAPPPPKADDEIKALEKQASELKKPDSKLLISDPDAWAEQNEEYESERVRLTREITKREVIAEMQKNAVTQSKSAEEQARGILREQFYRSYPVLRDQADIVDPILGDQFDNIVKSGKLARQMTPQEAEALKAAEFADVAAKSTKRIVRLMQGAKMVAPPPPPPPTLVSSAPAKAEKAPAPQVEKPKDKYPAGSMSALLAARRAAQTSQNRNM